MDITTSVQVVNEVVSQTGVTATVLATEFNTATTTLAVEHHTLLETIINLLTFWI